MSTFQSGCSYDTAQAWTDFSYVLSCFTGSPASDGFDRLLSIGEIAKDLGKAVGAVTTVPVSLAPPGAWTSHNDYSGNIYAIADEAFFEDPNTTGVVSAPGYAGGHWPTIPWVDVLIGNSRPEYVNSAIRDKLRNESGQPGKHTLVEHQSGQNGGTNLLNVANDPNVIKLAGLFYHVYHKADDSGYDSENPTLAESTLAALTVLNRSNNGFMLNVEGGAVDWAGHANNMDHMIGEEIDFNEAVQAVINWVDNPTNGSSWANTLVIVTADHETGYLTAAPYMFPDVPLGEVSAATLALEKIYLGSEGRRASWEDNDNDDQIDSGEVVYWAWNSNNHSNSLVPLYARGAGAELFSDIIAGNDTVRGDYINNTGVFTVMDAVLDNGGTLPTLSISEPDGTDEAVVVGDFYNITYSLNDPDDVVTAAFYYDTDNTGLDGTAIIGSCASAAEGTAVTCAWDTSGMTLGSYYVYGVTDDESGQVTVYSPGQITISSVGGISSNIAPLTTVTASSENKSTSQLAVKAVDGVVDGCPGGYTKEWTTLNEKSGAWIQLTWSSANTVDRIILYDRPNINDQILSATLSFSDGSILQVGPLDNAGGAMEYTFPAKVITSVTMTVDHTLGSTSNIGLAEIEVYNDVGGISSNIAPLATVTASSENKSTSQLAVKAVDGVADGYPGGYAKEWATLNEKSGAWIQLTWSSAYTVDRIILYDRPNINDQILSATLSFSDGSILQVGPLDNAGGATEYTFPAKVITSVTMTVDQTLGSTSNIGLAEIEVYNDVDGTPPPSIITEITQFSFFGSNIKLPFEWKHIGFDDSSWLVYSNGLDHDNNDNFINNNNVYARREFTVKNPALVTRMTLAVVCDSPFVAYLNGIEVARSKKTTTEPINISGFADEIVLGNNIFAIELNEIDESTKIFLIPSLIIGERVE
jgi:alkaline phosphatase